MATHILESYTYKELLDFFKKHNFCPDIEAACYKAVINGETVKVPFHEIEQLKSKEKSDDFNQLSIQITTSDSKTIKINDKKLSEVQNILDLIPFFIELMQHHTDYSNGQVLKLPIIQGYGKVKTKKCIRQLRELRILRFSRKTNCYVVMDGVYEEVRE